MWRIRRSTVALLILAFLGVFVIPLQSGTPSYALSGSEFQPGYIISDENFFASTSLNQSEISNFLVSKSSPCRDGYVCLKDYSQRTTNISSDSYCNGYLGQASESAAAIIAKTSISCGISPKVLIVLLQKEQGLVTSSSPADWRYNSATGMGCPDTAGCDSTVAGFFYQVFYAARSFKFYIANNGRYNYHWGQENNIQYNPNPSCGIKNVYIRNPATAALYIYTPYVPSDAALADLYGAGSDPGCSAYGNRNFWRYYSDWFGNPVGNSPVATIDSYQISPGNIRISGWALDTDTSSPIQIHAYFNGVGIPLVANKPRPDLANNLPVQYRGVGTNHGFDATIPVPASGPLQICLYAINVASGENNRFDCRNTGPLSGDPIGALDSVAINGNTTSISGWTLDPDTSNSIDAHIYLDGRAVGKTTANGLRADVSRVYTLQGPNHGFSMSFTASAGNHQLCVYGIENAGRGSNSLISCRDISVLGGSPVGALDAVTSQPGFITVSGWAFEPGNTNAIPVHVYVNGVGVAGATSLSRPDVQRAFPVASANSGFSLQVPAVPGNNSVCIYAIDTVGGDPNKSLGCRNVEGKAGSPFGVIDSLTLNNGSYLLRGWAIDPDQAGALGLHIYVDGQYSTRGITAISRPDVIRAFPGYENNKGYEISIIDNLSVGNHQVCIYGINSSYGNNSLISCRQLVKK